MLSHWALTTPWYYTPLVPLSSHHGSNQAYLLQCLETICNDPQSNQGFRQYIVVLLRYQQVPEKLRNTASTSGLRDFPPPPGPLKVQRC